MQAQADRGTEASGPIPVRYDDVVQDGRVLPHALPHALGAVAWPTVARDPQAQRLAADGVVPILVRMRVEATEARISPMEPLRGAGRWWSWTVRSPDGAVDRIVLSMRVEVLADQALVGTIVADHVFTRPFAPPGHRRVTDLAGRVPELEGTLPRFEAVGADVAHAVPDALVAFGLVHTDSNQHVNSLVYPRLFEDAAVRDRPDRPLTRWFEAAWRKPFFAGDTGRIRRWTTPDGGLAGAFVDADGAERCRIATGGAP
jgi:hypothetical protein